MIDIDGLEEQLNEIIEDGRGEQCYTKAKNVMALVKLIRENQKDAERYRWLRGCYWNDSHLCVVINPKSSIKLGTYCPSKELLDKEIDQLIEDNKNE